MNNTQFVPLSAAHIPNFYDEHGQPLGARTKCPTCQRSFMFKYLGADGEWRRFVGDCGHAFNVPTPTD